jgi:hypothetical protein
MINAGYKLLRFTAADIHQRPEVVEAQVRSALGTTPQNARLSPKTRNSKGGGARLGSNGRNGGGAGGLGGRGRFGGGVRRAAGRLLGFQLTATSS